MKLDKHEVQITCLRIESETTIHIRIFLHSFHADFWVVSLMLKLFLLI